jgi:hypothetical protein
MVMKMTMKFSREQLYTEIWEISARQVANKYDLNYPSLLKSCKENSIPLPNGRYWYHKNNGLDFKGLVIPLPNSDVKAIQVIKQTIKAKMEPVVLKKIQTPKDEVKQLETESRAIDFPNKFLFDVDVLRNSLYFLDTNKVEKIVSVLSKFEVRENRRLHKKVSTYKENIANWNKFVKANEPYNINFLYRRKSVERPKFIKEVSFQQLPRLFKILDTLFSIFDQIGEAVTDDLSIKIGDDIVTFEIIESTDKIKHVLSKAEAQELVIYNDEVKKHSYTSKPNIRKYDHLPTGSFKIRIADSKSIRDSKEKKLEELFPEIVTLFYQCYSEIRTRREEREKEQRLLEERKQKARIRQQLIDQEKKKTSEFLNLLSDYRLANEVREFVEVLKKIGKTDDETIQWMLSKAEWIDPTVSLNDDLLGIRDHQKSTKEKEDFLKSDRYFW